MQHASGLKILSCNRNKEDKRKRAREWPWKQSRSKRNDECTRYVMIKRDMTLMIMVQY